jgi:hypothetical protein
MPTANPQALTNGQWMAVAGWQKMIFATFDEAVAWIKARGGEVVVTDETRRII